MSEVNEIQPICIRLGADGSPHFWESYNSITSSPALIPSWDGRGFVNVDCEAFWYRMYDNPKAVGDTFSIMGHDLIVIATAGDFNQSFLCMEESLESHLVYINRMIHQQEMRVWHRLNIDTPRASEWLPGLISFEQQRFSISRMASDY